MPSSSLQMFIFIPAIFLLLPSHTTDRIEEHLQYLEELIPRWVKCITIRRCRYIKLNKNVDAKYVTQQLENAGKELRT